MSKPIIVAAAATAVLAGVGAYIWQDTQRPAILEVFVFSLKGGQAIFIRTPEDKRILINGGGNSEVIRFITRILPFYSRRIDAVIATKAAGGNTLGLIEIVNRYSIKKLYVPGISLEDLKISSTTDRVYETLLNATRRKNIPIHPVKSRNKIRMDSSVSAEVLFPATGDLFAYSKASAPEMALRITHGSNSILLLGDTSKKIQKHIAEDELEESDVLVMSNSVSSSSLSPELLSVAKPQFLIYEQPASRQAATLPAFGDGKKEVISNENKFNTKTTLVRVVSDGVKIIVEQD